MVSNMHHIDREINSMLDDINYELIFKNDEDKLIWENFIQKIQSEKGESLSQKIIGVLNKYV